MARTSTVYLLHFEPPYRAATVTGGVKVAGHYLGSTVQSVEARLREHLEGRGSPLVRAAVAAGSVVTVTRTWKGGRQLERQLKRRHRHASYCEACRG